MIQARGRLRSLLMAAALTGGVLGCVSTPEPEPPEDIVAIAPESIRQPGPEALPPFDIGPLNLTVIGYDQIDGWATEDHRQPFEAFKRSCRVMMRKDMNELLNENAPYAGQRRDWVRPCDAIIRIPDGDAYAARRFFELEFQPFAVKDDGLITGYYEPSFEARRTRSAEFSAPLLAPPSQMRSRRVGSETLVEYRQGVSYRPVPVRADIDERFSRVLAWMRPEELFFLQIQGSGRLSLEDGHQVLAAYAGHNGQPYTSIGKVLVSKGEMRLDEASADRISAWLRQNKGARAEGIMNANPRYVFFSLQPARPVGLGPDGAQGVPLTAGRSMAVDPRYHAYGAPIWVEAKTARIKGAHAELKRLLIAQDTGGAIIGPARGDVYFGSGPEAGKRAGVMNHTASFVLLIPRRLAQKLVTEMAED